MRSIQIIVASLVVLAIPALVEACGYGMPSPTARMAIADMVLVGKITGVESRSLRMRHSFGQEPLPHEVFVVKVVSMFKGDERLTHIRMALPKPQSMPVGFEAIFYLNAHAQEPVYILPPDAYDYPVAKESDPRFKIQVEQLKRMGQLLRDPLASLKSAKAEDRLLTAALLISEYRTFQPGVHAAETKTTPIDAATSKLILRALAETEAPRVVEIRLTTWRLFNMLGVKPADGFDVAKIPTTQERWDAARKWMKENEERFVIQAFARR